MRNLEKVIFDTNILRNTEPKTFLGGRDELLRFSKVTDIIFPEIVLEELKYQKRKQLDKHKNDFLRNPFHWLRNINQQETQDFDNVAHIEELENNENIKYSVIRLQDYSVLEQIKELALKKLPPFEENDGTDKGFKDAYIYFTILEYLQSIPDKYIFVCTKDGRFKEALQGHPNISVIKDFEEFRKESISSFYDEYFIAKFIEVFHVSISEKNIVEFWFNINGNRVVLIEVGDDAFVVEIDSGEIVSYGNKNDYDVNILINSRSYSQTHEAVIKLSGFKNFFSDDEIINIMQAAIENHQIIPDEDVQQFISDIFENKKDILDSEIKEQIENFLSYSK